MFSVRIGYLGHECVFFFRGEKEAKAEYDAILQAWGESEDVFVTDGFKRCAKVDMRAAHTASLVDEEAAAMARAEIQLVDARAQLAAQKRFQAEQPKQGIALPPGSRMNQ
jgi:hypothetical protein